MTMMRACISAMVIAPVFGAIAQAWTPVPVERLLHQRALADSLQAAMGPSILVMDLMSFRSSTDVVPYDRKHARLVRTAQGFRSEIGDVLMVQGHGLRVVVDRSDRTMLVTDPTALTNVSLPPWSEELLTSLGACYMRTVSDGVEFKLVMAKDVVHDHVLLQFDAQGWLRRSETFWRSGMDGTPGDPRLVVQYQRPVPLRAGTVDEQGTDPWEFVKVGPAGLIAIGEWNGIEVIDARIKP